MQTISYHAFLDKAQNTLIACSQNSDEHPLIVNCAGTTFIQWPFKTKNAQGYVYLVDANLSTLLD